MDVIEKIVAGHRHIFEKKDLLSKLIAALDSDAFFWDKAPKIVFFFKKEIREHIEMEEKVLFPVLKKALDADGLEALREIELEHNPILKRIDAFNILAENHVLFSSKASREPMVEAACGLIEVIAAHAGKEDKLLFPLIKDALRPEHRRELEALYFSFIQV